MVIKKAPKTKAFQKTTCIRNWKVREYCFVGVFFFFFWMRLIVERIKKFSKEVMRILKEENLKSHELLDQWANKDTKMIKSKKSRKSILDWNSSIAASLLENHRIKLLELQQQQVLSIQQRQLTSARFSQKNGNVRPINTNNKFEEAQREDSIVKKPTPSSPAAKVNEEQQEKGRNTRLEILGIMISLFLLVKRVPTKRLNQ